MSSIPKISTDHRAILAAAVHAYLNAPVLASGQSPIEMEADFDRRRVSIIEEILKPMLSDFLSDAISLAEFKRRIDGINKQNQLWGFSGIKGQMFFNMLVRSATELGHVEELDHQLKATLREPVDDEGAASKLESFSDYVSKLGKTFVDNGGSVHSKPKIGSVPFFVSYFWQIQDRDVWPVFYTNSVQMIESLNLWQYSGDASVDYLAYKHLHESLTKMFSSIANKPFSLYDVEHVFWFRSGKLLGGESSKLSTSEGPAPSPPGQETNAAVLPVSYVPPIVEIIPRLALNDSVIQEIAKNSGTTPQVALEKSIHAAFTILGYETRGMGQGMGRVPDGLAIATEESYAILWDAKARAEGYRMGTDDRAIRQYIEKQSRGLRGIRNIYFLVVSSKFVDEFDEMIRSLKMETAVNEVCLMEADALVAVVDQKLRSTLDVSLGPDGIQRLFSSSGIITASHVIETLG